MSTISCSPYLNVSIVSPGKGNINSVYDETPLSFKSFMIGLKLFISNAFFLFTFFNVSGFVDCKLKPNVSST